MTLIRHTFMLCALALTGLASPALKADNQWSEDLLGLAGTSVIFDEALVQNALLNNQTPDLEQILAQAGLKPWAGARLWLMQLVDNKPQPYAVSQALTDQANHRGLILDNTLNADSQAQLQQLFGQGQINWDDLHKLLASQHNDALLLLSQKNNLIFWQLFSPPQRLTGTISQDAAKFLPHIWSENLAMAWQWPELKQDILLRIDGITNLGQFKQAEQALKTACAPLRLLRVHATRTDFACHSANNLIPDKLNLIPQLVAKPASSKNLSTETLMGRQLAQRYAAYQWRDLY